jgi:hypothetical protein
MTKRLTPTGAGKSASLAEAGNDGVVPVTQISKAELSKELGFLPATAEGWTWTWQRCGRHDYQRCPTHSTNPDHLVPRMPSPTNVLPLQVAARYAAGRLRVRRRGQLEGD